MFQKQATVKQISFNQNNSAAAKSKRKPFLAQAQTKFVNISLLAAALVVGVSNSAIAETTLVFNEQTTSFEFIPGGSLPRQIGDVLKFETVLLDPVTNTQLGTKSGECKTTEQLANGDYIAKCKETITLGDGTIYTNDKLNQTALEQFQPQQLKITHGDGAYKSVKGNEIIKQTRFPDGFLIELRIN